MWWEDREDYKWAKFRWECLRRNPEAIRAVQLALRDSGTRISDLLLGFSARMSNEPSLQPEIDRLKADDQFWAFELPFDEIIAKIRENEPGIVGEILVRALMEPTKIKFKLSGPHLRIDIDLDGVYSINSLKHTIISGIQDHYEAAVKTGDVTPKKRPNMTDFDVILKVGDLKRQGKKNREIAKSIHPRKYRNNPESAIRQVGKYYKRYLELVDNYGFQNMSYP